MATHSSVLAWKIPWTGEPGRLQSMGSQRVRHDWATSLECFQYCENYEFSDWISTWCIGTGFNFPVGHSFSVSFTGEQCHTMLSQFSSVAQSCPTLCDPMNRSTPGLPVHHQLPEFTQTHIHGVSDAIQPSHALSSPSPPAPNPTQHQSLFQWVKSLHISSEVPLGQDLKSTDSHFWPWVLPLLPLKLT